MLYVPSELYLYWISLEYNLARRLSLPYWPLKPVFTSPEREEMKRKDRAVVKKQKNGKKAIAAALVEMMILPMIKRRPLP
jgi:hypothetical protein